MRHVTASLVMSLLSLAALAPLSTSSITVILPRGYSITIAWLFNTTSQKGLSIGYDAHEEGGWKVSYVGE